MIPDHLFALVRETDDHQIYTAWHGNLCFTILRYKDDTPDMLGVWNHDDNTLVLETEIPKRASR